MGLSAALRARADWTDRFGAPILVLRPGELVRVLSVGGFMLCGGMLPGARVGGPPNEVDGVEDGSEPSLAFEREPAFVVRRLSSPAVFLDSSIMTTADRPAIYRRLKTECGQREKTCGEWKKMVERMSGMDASE